MRLFDILGKSAMVCPDHKAVIHLDRRINYRDLYEASLKVADFLNDLNLTKGARIGILYENSIEYLITYFGVFGAGLVAVPIDTSLKPEKMADILSDCQAEVLICQSRYEQYLNKILSINSSVKCVITDRKPEKCSATIRMEAMSDILEKSSIIIPPNDYGNLMDETPSLQYDLKKEAAEAPHELAAIFYTSGSTGSSKGVMLSHRNLISNTIATTEYLKLSSADSVIVILPFYYIYGNSLLLTHILAGGTLVIDDRFMYPELILDTMEKERVTGFSGVPSNFMILLNNSTLTSRKLDQLHYFTQAGGAMAPEVIKRLMNSFPHKDIYIMYGQTEASPRVSYLPPERLKDKIGSIGIPVPGVNIRIVNDDNDEMPLGEVGEIAVAGDNVMLGYWNQPDEEKLVLRDGWLLTGDLARKDFEGYYYVVGRKKEIIKVGGNRVSAKEVEECILENEKVAEATVFGVKDDILGEAIKAVVVPKDGITVDRNEIRSFCKAKLSDYKVPKHVEFASSLPKYKSGKVNKLELMNRDV
ncbi:MAG: class I adenylate-forming enzyme family protein [candidate division Zixibacteria bacterium]|nr:class I adenylate-forming enzyme family protein [candidate division Zixibacteria bacterium]